MKNVDEVGLYMFLILIRDRILVFVLNWVLVCVLRFSTVPFLAAVPWLLFSICHFVTELHGWSTTRASSDRMEGWR